MTLKDKLNINQRRIGLTGGIASGKSTIARYISQNQKIKILDADIYSKSFLIPGTKSYHQIIRYFGKGIIDNQSSKQNINNNKLRKIIIDNPIERKWLENFLHPLIKEKMIKECISLEEKRILVLVIPLLFEAKFEDLCTEIWIVKCSKKIQQRRLIERDKVSAKEAEKMIDIQLSFVEKENKSDVILNNENDMKIWQDKINELI